MGPTSSSDTSAEYLYHFILQGDLKYYLVTSTYCAPNCPLGCKSVKDTRSNMFFTTLAYQDNSSVVFPDIRL